MDEFQKNFEHWKEELKGTEWQPALDELEKKPDDLKDSFYRDLEFGTAGMRGILGLGTNRMNVFTVRRATKAVADHINNQNQSHRGVAIAYDTRRNSELFAHEAAGVLLANGIKVYLYRTPHSVPQLSFTIRELDCAAGIVITASHNPPRYNGYKVYGEDGAQLPVADSDKIMELMEGIDYFGIDTAPLVEGDKFEYLGEKMDNIYYNKVEALAIDKDTIAKEADKLSVVYTPLYGTGLQPVVHVLKDLGLKNLYVVPEQEFPDPDFPTVSAPNPENREAYDLAILLADKVGANLILATDPDSDRLGVAVRNQHGEFVILTGNQIGCLLLDYILTRLDDRGELPKDAFIVKSLVSTDMADVIAKSFGVEVRNVYTGFKNIAEQIKIADETKEGTFIFGFEESYGYLRGPFVRDKDAVQGAMMVTEAACYYAAQGKTLYDAVLDMFRKYGWFKEEVISKTLYGQEGIEKIKKAVETLRENPPKSIGELPVIEIRDYLNDTEKNLQTGEEIKLGMDPMDVLYLQMENGRFIIRPSGTEPKLKSYLTVRADNFQDSEAMMRDLEDASVNMIEKLLD